MQLHSLLILVYWAEKLWLWMFPKWIGFGFGCSQNGLDQLSGPCLVYWGEKLWHWMFPKWIGSAFNPMSRGTAEEKTAKSDLGIDLALSNFLLMKQK